MKPFPLNTIYGYVCVCVCKVLTVVGVGVQCGLGESIE